MELLSSVVVVVLLEEELEELDEWCFLSYSSRSSLRFFSHSEKEKKCKVNCNKISSVARIVASAAYPKQRDYSQRRNKISRLTRIVVITLLFEGTDFQLEFFAFDTDADGQFGFASFEFGGRVQKLIGVSVAQITVDGVAGFLAFQTFTFAAFQFGSIIGKGNDYNGLRSDERLYSALGNNLKTVS